MSTKLTLVSGNKGKLTEWQRILPTDIKLEIHDVDIAEIQSLDPEEIVADKARRAYEQLQTPVIVEDVSAGIEKLGWLPGPFIKFFFKQLGEGALFTLAGKPGEPARVSCAIAYYDGKNLLTIKTENYGVVVEPRGANGFGFDKVFIPNGSTKTYGEMTDEEKDAVSHRAKAIKVFVDRFTGHIKP